jgi:hypothetical protein
MSWDVICPVCRVAANNVSSLSRVQGHGHCDVCNIDFEVDFSKYVEVVFSTHPEIRPIELKTYCIGGPFHAPHVLAQNRLLTNQFVDVGTELAPGKYQICGPQLPSQPDIKVHGEALATRAELKIGKNLTSSLPDLHPGAACVHIENQSGIEVLVRLEQASDREDSVTAASASRHPLFQKLFPQSVLSSEGLVDLSNVYLLAIKHLEADALIDKVGDVRVREYWTQLQSKLPTDSVVCEVVECTHESMLVSFGLLNDLIEMLDSVLSSSELEGIPVEECCFAINSGEVMIGSQENQPAMFGKTIRQTKKLLSNVTEYSINMPGEIHASIMNLGSGTVESVLDRFEVVRIV